ncbi:MAG: hypothetical protein LUD78_12885 [Clostridiales bacterium]|nr:hypothetical protein [Clostridiales bacterium]
MEQFLPEGRLISTPENQALLRTPEGLRQAMEEQTVLEAVPDKCDAAHDLHFRLLGKEVVMPREECAVGLEDGSTKEIAILGRVGKPTCFVVEGLPGEDGAVVPRISRRAAQERCLRWLMTLPAGTILPAAVTRLERFGAFVSEVIEQLEAGETPETTVYMEEHWYTYDDTVSTFEVDGVEQTTTVVTDQIVEDQY